MERYIKEYASSKIKALKENELMQAVYKNSSIEKIEKAFKFRDNGMITADETIKIILES